MDRLGMDLNTLPDEMLTNILKKTKFKRLLELRKINKRIDRLANRTKTYGKLPLQCLEITPNVIVLILRKPDASGHLKTEVIGFKCESDGEIHANMEEWSAKMKQILGNDTAIKRKLISNGLSLLTNDESTFAYKRDENILFFTSPQFPQQEVLQELVLDIIDDRPLFQIKKPFYDGFQHELVICCKTEDFDILVLDDKFLLDVATHCNRLIIYTRKWYFTLNGIMNMIKNSILNVEFTQLIMLFTSRPTMVPGAEFETELKTEIPGIVFTDDTVGHYRVTRPNNRKTFHFEMSIQHSPLL